MLWWLQHPKLHLRTGQRWEKCCLVARALANSEKLFLLEASSYADSVDGYPDHYLSRKDELGEQEPKSSKSVMFVVDFDEKLVNASCPRDSEII